VALVQDLREAHPEPEIELVFCSETLGLNPKISSLRQMETRVRYDLLVIADADVKVGPDFLSRVAAALQEPGMGLVSCVYRFGPARTLGAKMEALTIAADFIPSVVTAHYVEGIRFALGAAMALTRQAWQTIGGFAPLADFLADDYQLGYRIAEASLGVKVLSYVIETQNPDLSLQDYLLHQLRWARASRICRPKAYLAYGITHALVYSLILCGASGAVPWTLGWLAATLTLRWTLAALSEWNCLRGHLRRNDFWLLPVKDLLYFGIWALSFLGDRVMWGGRQYSVSREGRLMIADKKIWNVTD
jgi:ceramide glucosyltransferase